MAKFVYKMQNLLNIKLKLEEQKKSEYAQAKAKLIEEETTLKKLLAKKNFYINRKREGMRNTLNINELKMLENGIKATDMAIETQKTVVKKAEAVVNTAHKKMLEATKERKMHEKLRENAFEEFKLEYEKEEQKVTDELVSNKYHSRVEE